MSEQTQQLDYRLDYRFELRMAIRSGLEKEIIENAGKILGFDSVELIDVEELAREREHKIIWILTDMATVTRFVVDWDKKEIVYDDTYVENLLEEQGINVDYEIVESFDNEEDLAYTIYVDKKNGIVKVEVQYYVEGDWSSLGYFEQYTVLAKIKQ